MLHWTPGSPRGRPGRTESSRLVCSSVFSAIFLIATAASFFALGTVVRADNLFVAFDSNNNDVQEYATAQITGSYTGTTYVNDSSLQSSCGVAFDSNGNLYVSNAGNNTITEYAPPTSPSTSGSLIRTISATGVLNQPRALAFDQSGNLFIANTNGGNVLEVTATNLASSGSPTVTAYASGVGSAYGLAFDKTGNLYVSDWGNSTIYQIQPGGSPTVYIRTPSQNNTIDQPAGLAFDSQGNLYVANDGTLDNIEEFTGTNADGAIASGTAQFLDSPEGIAFDSKGDLFVVNYSHTPPDTGQPLSYGYSSIDEFAPASQGSTLLNTFNVDTSTDFSLKDGGFIAIESDSGVPLLDSVPEPSALGLTILGIASLAGFTWKRRRL